MRTGATVNNDIALLVSGSPAGVDSHLLHELAAHTSFVLAADAGAEMLASADIVPDLLIGDFDSLSPETLALSQARGVATQSYDPYKDATDLELALEALRARGYQRIIATNVLGGRADHALGSLAALAAAARRGVQVALRDQNEACFFVGSTALDTPLTLDFKELAEGAARVGAVVPTSTLLPRLPRPSYVSLMAWGGPVSVSLQGTEWPLLRHILTPESALGISNELRSETLSLEVHEGPGIVLLFLVYE